MVALVVLLPLLSWWEVWLRAEPREAWQIPLPHYIEPDCQAVARIYDKGRSSHGSSFSCSAYGTKESNPIGFISLTTLVVGVIGFLFYSARPNRGLRWSKRSWER